MPSPAKTPAATKPLPTKKSTPASKASMPLPTIKATLFIGKLPFAASKEEIAAHFAEASGMDAAALLPSVRMLMNDGKFKGTAFVDMADWEAVDKGCALNGSTFKAGDGTARTISVREAVPKTQLQKQAAVEEMARKKRAAAVAAADAAADKKRDEAASAEEEDEFTRRARARMLAGAEEAGVDSDEEDSDDDEEGEKAQEEEVDEKGEGEDTDEEEDEEGGEDEERDHNGEVDPQRLSYRAEKDYLKQRRALEEMSVKCSSCSSLFIFSVREQVHGRAALLI